MMKYILFYESKWFVWLYWKDLPCNSESSRECMHAFWTFDRVLKKVHAYACTRFITCITLLWLPKVSGRNFCNIWPILKIKMSLETPGLACSIGTKNFFLHQWIWKTKSLLYTYQGYIPTSYLSLWLRPVILIICHKEYAQYCNKRWSLVSLRNYQENTNFDNRKTYCSWHTTHIF